MNLGQLWFLRALVSPFGRKHRPRPHAVVLRPRVRPYSLQLEMLEARLTPTAPVVSILNPTAHSHTAAVSANLQATFDQALNSAKVTDQTFVVHGQQTGRLRTADGDSFSASGAVVTVDPAANFHPGELVQVTATSGIENGGS